MADETVGGFAALYEQHKPHLYRYFYQHTRNPQDAEDLTAATFTKALTSLERYEERGYAGAWLFGIACHTLRDAQRRQRTHLPLDEVAPFLADSTQEPETYVLEDEQSRILNSLLWQLPPEQRAAVMLRFFADMSTGEAAAKLGRSAGAVKMLVHRAVAMLRERFRQTDKLDDALTSGSASIAALVDSILKWTVVGAAQPALQPVVYSVPVSRRSRAR